MPSNGRRHELYYGGGHRALRALLADRVAAGAAVCWRCGKPIAAGEPWDLGHVDGGSANEYAGPEHRRCNRATALRWEIARRTSRDW